MKISLWFVLLGLGLVSGCLNHGKTKKCSCCNDKSCERMPYAPSVPGVLPRDVNASNVRANY